MAPSFSLVDIVAVILLIASIVNGFRRGVSPGFVWFCGSLIGLLCGFITYPRLARLINFSGTADETLVNFCSLIGSALVVFLVLMSIRYLLGRLSVYVTTLFMDRIAGALAGLIQTAIIIVLLFFALTSIDRPFLQKTFAEDSAIGRPIVALKHRMGLTLESDYNRVHNRMIQQREQRSDQRTQPR